MAPSAALTTLVFNQLVRCWVKASFTNDAVIWFSICSQIQGKNSCKDLRSCHNLKGSSFIGKDQPRVFKLQRKKQETSHHDRAISHFFHQGNDSCHGVFACSAPSNELFACPVYPVIANFSGKFSQVKAIFVWICKNDRSINCQWIVANFARIGALAWWVKCITALYLDKGIQLWYPGYV